MEPNFSMTGSPKIAKFKPMTRHSGSGAKSSEPL